MATDWRNQRLASGEPQEMYQFRVSSRTKERAIRIAARNNTTLAAILRFKLDQFIEIEEAAEAAKTGKSGALFD